MPRRNDNEPECERFAREVKRYGRPIARQRARNRIAADWTYDAGRDITRGFIRYFMHHGGRIPLVSHTLLCTL